jgi:opacity protein-like surface antigen
MRRTALLVASAAALLLAGAGVASADTAHPQVDKGWACAGDTCLRVLPDAAAVPMDANGCNHQVCIEVRGNAANGYSTVGRGSGFYGKIHVWGPNLNTWGNDANNPVASGSGHGSGQTCAEGWKLVSGTTYTSVGLPCEQVS